MPVPFALLVLAAAPPDDFAAYRAATRATVPCDRPTDSRDVTVCARREADRRYRVPLVAVPARDQVHVRTDRLLEDKIDHCGRHLMTYGCGFVGVTMTSNGVDTGLKPRKLKED